jgi:hypothetical protein
MEIKYSKLVFAIIIFGLFGFENMYSRTPIDFSKFSSESEISIKETRAGLLLAEWKDMDGGRFSMTLDFDSGVSLFKSIKADNDSKGSMTTIASDLHPRFDVTIGARDTAKKWPYIFFDRVDTRPYETITGDFTANSVEVVSEGIARANIKISEIRAGSFNGDMIIKLYSGSPFILVEAAMMANQANCAYIFDGLLSGDFSNIVYKSNETDKYITEKPENGLFTKKVRNRTIMAQFDEGTLAIFPAPHAFIYPLDFSDNYGFVQAGRENGKNLLGTKSQPNGDNRYRPWIDAPKGRIQHMGFFLLISRTDAQSTLERVKKYTHGDTYKEIPGHITFANHFHSAITMTEDTDDPSGPKFRDAMMALNVKTVELAEFHGDGNPRDTTLIRLNQLKKMFEVCEKYSVPGEFTMIPGEEANAFFPGHTMYFFPKPVYLTLRRGKSQPFKESIPGFGEVYHAGSEEDIYNIYKENGGLVWSSHPRTKGSLNKPDLFVDHASFQDDNVFSGGDWKAMPLDLSDDRLGIRALKLLDDMNQMGFRKRLLGEVDPFKIDVSHELYAHMNINYLKVSSVPPAADWSPVFNAIKDFEYFTSTGEVLIHSWEVSAQKNKVTANMEWTFPMAFAEITWGEGDEIMTKTIPLKETKELVGSAQYFEWDVDLSRAKWVRFEAWDIARNGAFTPTVWLTTPERKLNPIVYSFSLVDGDNGCVIPEFDPILEGDIIDLSTLPSKNIQVRANSNLMATVKIQFGFDGNSNIAKVESFPYQSSFLLSPGRHSISGTPTVGEIVGATRMVNFEVLD